MIQNNKLEIFENFVKNPGLKKQSKLDTTSGSGISTFSTNIFGSNGVGRSMDVSYIEYLEYVYSQNATIINWVKLRFAKSFSVNRKVKRIKYQSIETFFSDIKNSVKTLNIDDKSLDFYTHSIKDAIDNGQVALKEILTDKKDTVIEEFRLLNLGVVKYVDEDDVVKFFQKSKLSNKTLKLTWIKNYTRVIPTEIIDLKRKLDDKESFDNYVVLHFDKSDDSTQMTAKEKEDAKDPILFGVSSKSRKLFYVGDWEDEYCDLTLDKFLEVLEMESEKTLSSESIKNETLK